MTQTYPDDSVQGILGEDWWVAETDTTIRRGRLVKAFVPYVDQLPYVLVPTGRADDDRQHTLAECEIKPLNVNAPPEASKLPVAGLVCQHDEILAVYRAKKRPILILAEPGQAIPHGLMAGKPGYMSAPALLGAPFFGRDEGTGKRSGYPQAFVDRVRHGEYRQYFWDQLPIGGANESLMRVEHLQPIGSHYMSLEPQPWRLSDAALEIIDDWLTWHLTGVLPKDCALEPILELLATL